MKVRHGFDGTAMTEQTKLEQFDREKDESKEENDIKIQDSALGIFKRDLIEFLDTSTTHGFARIANATCWISRIAWMIIVLCLISYLARAVYNLHLRLTSNKINVIVKSKTVSALEFPAITVCDGIPHLKSVRNNTDVPIRTILQVEQQHMQRILTKESIHNHTMYNFILKDESGEMPLCQFSGEQCVFNKHVKGRLPILHKGQCYTFNQDGSFKQIIQGPTMGVFAVFYLANEANTTKSIGATSTHGIEVFIHNANGKYPTTTDGILGIPGHLTRISVKQKIYKRLPEPYPDKCVDDNEKGNPHECQIKCIALHQIKQCKVISPTIKQYFKNMHAKSLGNMSSAPIPTTDEEHDCLGKVVENFAKEHLQCECYMPCYEKVFDYSISQSKWPHDDNRNEILLLLKSQLGINVTEQQSSRHLAAIQVYYSQLQYDEILQLPEYSVDKFLSDLGGLLGLFIGASVFSGIDFLICLLSTILSQTKIFLEKLQLPGFKKETFK